MPTLIPVYILPGGRMPHLHDKDSDENVGFDLFTRALVSLEMDEKVSGMRRTLCDFSECSEELIPGIFFRRAGSGYSYRLDPICRPEHPIIIGFGVVLGLPTNWYAEVWPRTSTAGNSLILSHKGIPIDPGFRGEFVTGICNQESSTFHLTSGQKLAQIKFHGPGGDFRPTLVPVRNFEDLPKSKRMFGNHGSTGSH
ncbi:MAG: hypothetical protein A3C06_00295 [Candidatus Taylorbacteria bacterium RIFCSPHIGHO2_02_FULL_46_13]|uniref:Uncharacterized protein n=1 Tax=Candidatus Taylorbacteria bacterium RIFCSPHIGHO2_02_FULL_46_13 TaxID=1802312 RepID=A0A1G2MWH5_9BACT|nr:MAG: hypothetical protein A3C06_00295 [Candidatus Taylorbacteria bacterium RIFCSPHIGHO2_02_FULL_46_13]